MVFFLTQNMASSQYIQERIKIQKEDGKKKEDVEVFSLPFQWKLQSIPEASLRTLSLPPIIQSKIIIIGPDDPLSSLPTVPILLLCDVSTAENAFNDLTTFFSFSLKKPKTKHPANSGVATQNCCLLWGYLCLLQSYKLYKGKFRNYHIPYPVLHIPLASQSCDLHLFLI